MDNGSESKPKKKKKKNPEKGPYGNRALGLLHLANHMADGDLDYLNGRYWEGFRTGILQVVNNIAFGEVDIIVKADKTLRKKPDWKRDPLKNGLLNGRRFALMMELHVDYQMEFGEWGKLSLDLDPSVN